MVKKITKKFIRGPVPILDTLRYYVHSLNVHPLFIGLMVIMTNLVSKHITLKLSKSQEQYIKNSLGRQFLIFAIMWSGTRDIVYAFLLTGTFIVLADNLLNEDSQYCVIPNYLKNYIKIIDTNNDGYVSKKEEKAAIQTLDKLKQQKKKQAYLRHHT